MNSLPPPIPPPPVSGHPGPPSNDDSNFAGPLRYDNLAIASLVCLIVILPSRGLTALPAFVLGILSLKRIKAEPERLKGRGMDLAGIIIPPLAILAFFAVFYFALSDGIPGLDAPAAGVTPRVRRC